jgi:hypothetical protein
VTLVKEGNPLGPSACGSSFRADFVNRCHLAGAFGITWVLGRLHARYAAALPRCGCLDPAVSAADFGLPAPPNV